MVFGMRFIVRLSFATGGSATGLSATADACDEFSANADENKYVDRLPVSSVQK